jgi:hypothetical protein
MVGIAIAALDFAAIRATIGYTEIGVVVLGALPMANALVVATLVARQHPASRPFLLGFGAFGAMALALFATLASLDQADVRIGYYLAPVLGPMDKVVGQQRPFVYIPLAGSIVMVMLAWPQVAFALIGGLLSRRFKITITRR